jgi:hypothetical protein
MQDKSLAELIDIAIGMSSYTGGSLSTTWQIFVQRYPRKEGDGFAEGELAYEIGKHGESLFGDRPAYKTIREALVAFVRRGLDDARKRQQRDEDEAARSTKSADEWRQHVERIEALISK